MKSLESIRKKISSTEDLQSLARSMKAVSSANIRHYEHAEASLREFRETIDHGLQILLHASPVRMRLEKSGGGVEVLVAFGSDRGLCGSFNETIAELVRRHVVRRSRDEGQTLVLAVGELAAARMMAIGITPDSTISLPATTHGLGEVCERIVIWINQQQRINPIEHVTTIFNVTERNEQNRTRAHVLLPVPINHLRSIKSRPWPSRRLPIFDIPPDELFSWLIRQHLFADLYNAGLSSMMSENIARLAAMHRAERNIGEMLDELTAEYRQSRQNTITGELMDIVSGYEVLRNDGED